MTKIRQNAEFFVILARLMLATVAASVPANAQEAWPKMLVDDKQCRVPLTIGEDYCGAACTGTVIASVANREVPTGTAVGRGVLWLPGDRYSRPSACDDNPGFDPPTGVTDGKVHDRRAVQDLHF